MLRRFPDKTGLIYLLCNILYNYEIYNFREYDFSRFSTIHGHFWNYLSRILYRILYYNIYLLHYVQMDNYYIHIDD